MRKQEMSYYWRLNSPISIGGVLYFISCLYLAFIAGVMVSEVVKIPRLREFLYSYRRSILPAGAVLFLVGLLPASVPNMVVTVLYFICLFLTNFYL